MNSIPTRLKFYADVIAGQSPSNGDVSDQGELPFIQGCAEFGDWNPVPSKYCELAPKVAEAGDVLISVRAPVGNLNIVEKKIGIGRGVSAIRAHRELNSRFMYWLLSASNEELRSHATGTTFEAVTASDIGNLPFVAVSWPVQERIANYLDDKTARINALIAEKEELLKSLSTARESYAFHLVTEGLFADAPRLKRPEEWFACVPAHWGTPKLGYFAQVGNGSTPRREVEAYWFEGTVPWITSTAVNNRFISKTDELVTELAAKESHLRVVRPGSAIVGLIGQGPTRGMTAQLTIPATLSQNVAYVSVTRADVLDEYLVVALSGLYSVLRYMSDGSGGAQGAMNCDTLRNFRIPVPPLAEQAEIVAMFRTKETAFADLQAHVLEHIARLREYRSSLISAAVTGQLYLGAAEVAA